MDLYADVTIDGKPHGLRFIDLKITQELMKSCDMQIYFGFEEHETSDIIDKTISSWLGKKMVLTISDKMDSSISKKYEGIVTSFNIWEGFIRLNAASEDSKMDYNARHRSWADKSINDVANEIVQSYSFSNSIMTSPSSSLQFKFLHQYDEYERDFLSRISSYDGCVFYHDGERFVYEPKLSGSKQINLGLENISDCYLRGVIRGTKFRGAPYEYLKHSTPASNVVDSGNPQLPSYTHSSDVYNKAKSEVTEKHEIYNRLFTEKSEFEKLIKNRQTFRASGLVRLEGEVNHPMVTIGRSIVCNDHPILKDPFVVIKLDVEFSGNVYKAQFVAAVKDTVTTLEYAPERDYIGLLQPAEVVDNKDPNGLGRVQIKYMWDTDNNAHAWARVVVSFAGADHGSHYTPRVGDQVLVGCEHGNASLPVVLGSLYHSDNKPDFKTDNGTEEVLLTKTPAGSEIRVVDKQGSEQIILSMPNQKNVLKMELQGPKITIESVGGTIEVQSKTVNITADDKITLTAKDIEITAQNDFKQNAGNKAELNAATAVKISSTQVESSAMGNNVIKGAIVQIN